MYIIQVRTVNEQRGILNVINALGNPSDWTNYTHQFEDIDSAVNECKIIISQGKYRAKDVRIVEPIVHFQSEIIVTPKHLREEDEPCSMPSGE